MKSEETTTPYPTDEEATDCGENCSFEDGEDGVVVVFHWGGMDASQSQWRLVHGGGQDLGVPWSEVRKV